MIKMTNAARQVMHEVKKVVIGKDRCIELVMAAIISGGHILIDDIPGVGKTTLALAFSKSMSLTQKRVQFTPDILPSDVTGFSMYQKEKHQFTYVPGPVMSNLFLADEINRTSPKTQSALLEVMEEGRVTIDGNTMNVPKPFIVIATQNPAGSLGTQNLPESQLDRFMICLKMGYPDIAHEINIIKRHHKGREMDTVRPVIDASALVKMQEEVNSVFIHDAVYEYIAKLVSATREHELLKLGVSPRGTIALCKMAQGKAYIQNRDYVMPEDVADVFLNVAGHRVILQPKARVNQMTVNDILVDILHRVPKPVPRG